MKLKDGSLVLHSPAEATPDLEAVVGKLGNRVSGIIGKFCSAAILKIMMFRMRNEGLCTKSIRAI